MNTENKEKPWDVAKATRDAIVGTAAGVQVLKKKTTKLAQAVEKKWQESKPRQQRAKEGLKRAVQRAVGFGKGVRKGIREGIAQVQKGNKNK